MESERRPNGGVAYWRANLRLIAILLIVWAAVSYVAAIFLANPLYGVNLGKIPLSFWFAQQGSMLVFVVLIFVYAKMMDGIDRQFDVHE
ncbi:MAG: DUF4212 domain-containing protein [Thermoleophilia bacterium]